MSAVRSLCALLCLQPSIGGLSAQQDVRAGYETGKVELAEGRLVIDLPEGLALFRGASAQRMATEAGAASTHGILALIVVPSGAQARAIILREFATGYIAPPEPEQLEAEALMQRLAGQMVAVNRALAEQGRPRIEIYGWGQEPSFDPEARTLSWARQIRGGPNPEPSTIYDRAYLARTSVFQLTGTDKVGGEAVARVLAQLEGRVQVQAPHRHRDFEPAADRRAGFGAEQLVTGEFAQGDGRTPWPRILLFGGLALALLLATRRRRPPAEPAAD